MELAGRFASANHNIIHQRVAAAVGLKEAAVVENHHNFAWHEKLPDGRKVIVHRKGATPASSGHAGNHPRLDGRCGLSRARQGRRRIAGVRFTRSRQVDEPQSGAEFDQQVGAG